MVGLKSPVWRWQFYISGRGVVPCSGAGEGWCSELKGQCQGGWWDRCAALTNEVSPLMIDR